MRRSDGQCGRGGQTGQRVGLNILVRRDEVDRHVDFGVVIRGEQGPEGAVDQAGDEDKAEEIYLYFKEDAETDSLDEAIKELGGDFTEEEIRLVRIKIMSELGN